MVREGIWHLGVTGGAVTVSLKRAEETDGRKSREGLQQIVTCGSCCCVFVSCHCGFPPLGSPFQKCARETGFCLPSDWGVWLNHPSLQGDHAIASAEGLQGPGVFPKADKNILLLFERLGWRWRTWSSVLTTCSV